MIFYCIKCFMFTKITKLKCKILVALAAVLKSLQQSMINEEEISVLLKKVSKIVSS